MTTCEFLVLLDKNCSRRSPEHATKRTSRMLSQYYFYYGEADVEIMLGWDCKGNIAYVNSDTEFRIGFDNLKVIPYTSNPIMKELIERIKLQKVMNELMK